MKKLILAVGVVSLSASSQLFAENSIMDTVDTMIDAGEKMTERFIGSPEKSSPDAVSSDTDAGSDPSSTVAFDKETRDLLSNASIERGRAVAKEGKCARCHGDNGVSDDADNPTLAGQLATYLYKQLMDYKSGHRDAHIMKKAVKKLDAKMLADLAVWYESLPTPEPMRKGDSFGDVGFDMVYLGDPKRMIKPCGTCHGRNGEGAMQDFARLNGQGRDYFIDTMDGFKEGDRTNDIYSRMRLIAKEMTDKEIEAVADFYAATPPADD